MSKSIAQRMGKDVDMSMEKDMEKRQMEQLRIFDKELYSYTGELAWFFRGGGAFMALSSMAIPVSEFDKGVCFVLLGSMWISYLVLLPYVNPTEPLSEKSKKSSTWAKLRYLPIGKEQYIRGRMRYLFRYLWKLALFGLLIQGLMTMADGQSFGIANLLYVFGVLIVLPMFAGWVQLVGER